MRFRDSRNPLVVNAHRFAAPDQLITMTLPKLVVLTAEHLGCVSRLTVCLVNAHRFAAPDQLITMTLPKLVVLTAEHLGCVSRLTVCFHRQNACAIAVNVMFTSRGK